MHSTSALKAASCTLAIHSLKLHSIRHSRKQLPKPSYMCSAHPGIFSCTSHVFRPEKLVIMELKEDVSPKDPKLFNGSLSVCFQCIYFISAHIYFTLPDYLSQQMEGFLNHQDVEINKKHRKPIETGNKPDWSLTRKASLPLCYSFDLIIPSRSN